MTSTITEPCIKKCNLNAEELCLGCFRTFKDICQWNKASTKVKEKILIQAEERRLAYMKDDTKR